MTFESIEYDDDETERNAERQLAEYHAHAATAEQDLRGYKLAADSDGNDPSWPTVHCVACGNPVFGLAGHPHSIDLAALLQIAAAHRCPEPSELKKAIARVFDAWRRTWGTGAVPASKEGA